MTPWQALDLDLLDWCHTAQPDDVERLAAIQPRLQAAGLDLTDAEALELLQELLDANEPPAPHEPAPRPAPSPAAPPASSMHDAACQATIAQRPNTLIAWLLIAGYAYHHLDRPILSDGCWDALCRQALAQWDTLQHPHKHLISRDDLAAGSLYALPAESYPTIAVSSARRLLSEGFVPIAPSGYVRMHVAPLPMPPAVPGVAVAKPPLARKAKRPAITGSPQLELF